MYRHESNPVLLYTQPAASVSRHILEWNSILHPVCMLLLCVPAARGDYVAIFAPQQGTERILISET